MNDPQSTASVEDANAALLQLFAQIHGISTDRARLIDQFFPPGEPFGPADLVMALEGLGFSAQEMMAASCWWAASMTMACWCSRPGPRRHSA